MATPDQKLFVLFGPLVKRITSIENYDNSLIPDFQGNIIKELNEVEVYKISPLETIPFVNNFIDRIYEVIGNHESLKEKIYYSLSDSLMAARRITGKKVSKKAKEADEDWLEKQSHAISVDYENELKLLIDDLLKLLEGLEKYKALAEPALPAATGAEIPDRLRFNLTIEELIAMIKIMMDCGVIPEIKRSELKLIVRKHFESKNGNEIGDISFERQLSPTVPTISKLEDMFLDLHKKCTTLKKEKAKKSQ